MAERGPDRSRSSAGAAGDFDSSFRDHFASMVRLAHLLGSDDPENAAQEAFSRLHARLSRLAEPERAVGYLRACLINITRARHTHLAVVARHPATPDANVASAESTFLVTADRAVIIAALSRLSPRRREALVLRYWPDLSEKQIAEPMGTSVVTGMTAILRFAGGADRTATLCALVTDTDHSNLARGSADLGGSTLGYLAMISGRRTYLVGAFSGAATSLTFAPAEAPGSRGESGTVVVTASTVGVVDLGNGWHGYAVLAPRTASAAVDVTATSASGTVIGRHHFTLAAASSTPAMSSAPTT